MAKPKQKAITRDPVDLSFVLSDVMSAVLLRAMQDCTTVEFQRQVKQALRSGTGPGRLTFSRLSGHFDVEAAQALLPFLETCSRDLTVAIGAATRAGFDRRARALKRWLAYDAVSIIGALASKKEDAS